MDAANATPSHSIASTHNPRPPEPPRDRSALDAADEGPHEPGTPVQARIRPWVDPIVDRIGHDPRGWYFERYWLSVIGPTATMVMRRLADGFDRSPDGFVLDLGHCAATMGLSFRRGAASPFGRALQRCVMFGLARQVADGFVVRRWVPDVAERHLQRLPDDVQAGHAQNAHAEREIDCAHLAQRLTEVGVPPLIARRAADATRLAR